VFLPLKEDPAHFESFKVHVKEFLASGTIKILLTQVNICLLLTKEFKFQKKPITIFCNGLFIFKCKRCLS